MSLRIGTSGWHYKHWIGRFYPRGMPSIQYLNYYCQRYNTVELNGVFYRLPKPEAAKHWYSQTPKNFRFAYKASRFITHMKKLKDPREPLKLMFKRADLLKEKLGPILFQLPPHWPVNIDRLHSFLRCLPKGYDYVMEFRESSWFTEAVYNVLETHGVGLCLYDMKSVASPERLTSKLVYVRFHGSSDKYAGLYSHTVLVDWATKIKRWLTDKRRVWVYFNNDTEGHAILNADELKGILGV